MMKQKLEDLLEFQKAEVEIERVQKVLGDIPEKLESLEAKEKDLMAEFEKEKEALSVLKKKYREMESDVQSNSDQIKKSQEKLSAVKTNKEYHAMLKEIEEINERNSGIEDEMLACLEEMESAEAHIKERNGVLKQVLADLTSDMEALRNETKENESRLQEARRHREAMAKDVAPPLMADYERAKRNIRGRVVVPVRQEVFL